MTTTLALIVGIDIGLVAAFVCARLGMALAGRQLARERRDLLARRDETEVAR